MDFDFQWAAEHLLSSSALADYVRITESAWADYERITARTFGDAYQV